MGSDAPGRTGCLFDITPLSHFFAIRTQAHAFHYSYHMQTPLNSTCRLTSSSLPHSPQSTGPTNPLHSNREQLNLRATTRDPARNEKILPKELRDAVPPIASCTYNQPNYSTIVRWNHEEEKTYPTTPERHPPPSPPTAAPTH